MRVLILGSDGYIGWALSQYLKEKDHTIYGLDNFSRRERVAAAGSNSLVPINRREREKSSIFERRICSNLATTSFESLRTLLAASRPHAIVHLAQMPSAPWSMKSSWYAAVTQRENVVGTLNLLWAMKEVCPDAHLIKLGTMGEYGTPNCDIPEGEIPEECIGHFETSKSSNYVRTDTGFKLRCPMANLPFPRSPGSFYHLSKVHDTHNIIFACKVWGLTSTDIMQGVVFGNEYNTRFDYDEYFGTAINRFCAQAIISHPLTVYGKGNQTRGFLPLSDSLKCLEVAIHNPPQAGEYRTLNQFENIYTINELAEMVKDAIIGLGGFTWVYHIPNPRVEMEDHYYNPTHQKLFDLGYKPTTDIKGMITALLMKLAPYKNRVIERAIIPKTAWR